MARFRIADLVVRFRGENRQFVRTARQVREENRRLAREARRQQVALRNLGASFRRTTAAVALLGAAFVAVVKRSADMGAQLLENSRLVGLTVENYQALTRVLAGDGLGLERAQRALQRFNQSLDEARQGKGEYLEIFERLGIDPASISGVVEGLEMVQDRLADLSRSEQLAIGADLFGQRGARAILPLVSGEALREQLDYFDRLLSTITQAEAEALKSLGQSFQNLGDQVGATVGKEVAAIADDLERATDALTQAIPRWIRWFKDRFVLDEEGQRRFAAEMGISFEGSAGLTIRPDDEGYRRWRQALSQPWSPGDRTVSGAGAAPTPTELVVRLPDRLRVELETPFISGAGAETRQYFAPPAQRLLDREREDRERARFTYIDSIDVRAEQALREAEQMFGRLGDGGDDAADRLDELRDGLFGLSQASFALFRVFEDGTNRMEGAFGTLIRLFQFTTGVVSLIGAIRDIRGQAAGGPVRPGLPYLVGERGPELVSFGQSGRVHSALETARMGGGNTYRFTINTVDATGVERVMRRIVPGIIEAGEAVVIREAGRPSAVRGAVRDA